MAPTPGKTCLLPRVVIDRPSSALAARDPALLAPERDQLTGRGGASALRRARRAVVRSAVPPSLRSARPRLNEPVPLGPSSREAGPLRRPRAAPGTGRRGQGSAPPERKSVGEGKRGSVRLEPGGR